MQDTANDPWTQELGSVNLIDHALAYAERGWHVFPIWWVSYPGSCACVGHKTTCVDENGDFQTTGKHPMPPNGLEWATTDENLIRKAWTKYPLANIGIATGHKSGFVVLDIDTDKDGEKSLRNHLKKIKRGMPPTVGTRTGGGGVHIFWKHPGFAFSNKVGILPGVDVRGDGGYIIAPPSMHECGIRYRWHEDGHPRRKIISSVPQWYYDLCKPKEHKPRGEAPADLENLPRRIGEIMDGTRNTRLYQIASRLKLDGHSFIDAENVLRRVNSECCKPPYPMSGLAKILNSAFKGKI